jgi:hypothetical protein
MTASQILGVQPCFYRTWCSHRSVVCGHDYSCLVATLIRDMRPPLFVHDGDVYPRCAATFLRAWWGHLSMMCGHVCHAWRPSVQLSALSSPARWPGCLVCPLYGGRAVRTSSREMPRDLFKNRLPGISHDDLGFYSLNHIFISSSRKVAYRRQTLYVLWSHGPWFWTHTRSPGGWRSGRQLDSCPLFRLDDFTDIQLFLCPRNRFYAPSQDGVSLS